MQVLFYILTQCKIVDYHAMYTMICMMSVSIRFGQMVRQLRDKQGISQEQLANGVGVSRLSINNYEQGAQSPSLDTAMKIVLYLDIDLADLAKLVKKSFLKQELEKLSDNDPPLSKRLQNIADNETENK